MQTTLISYSLLRTPGTDNFFSLFIRKEIKTRESEKKWKQENQKGTENKKTRKGIKTRKSERKWKQDNQKGNWNKKPRKIIKKD